MTIIDGSDAGDDTRFVIEHGFNDVGLNTQHGHVGGNGATDVMNAPIRLAHSLVHAIFQTTKTRNGRVASGGEHQV